MYILTNLLFILRFMTHVMEGMEKEDGLGFRINCSVSQDAKHCLRMDGKENKSIRINLEKFS